MDLIRIEDLAIECIIGVRPEERVRLQTVQVSLALGCDLAAAGRSDDLADTIDYRAVRDRVIACACAGKFLLVERLAQAMADCCLEADPRVRQVTVAVDKPGALSGARAAGVTITRTRSCAP